MIGNYILTITKGEIVRQYLYPIGNEKRVEADISLALRGGYVVLVVPPERTEEGMHVLQYRQLFPLTNWQDFMDTAGNVVMFQTRDDAMRHMVQQRENPDNMGYEFRVQLRALSAVDDGNQAAAERRDYQV